MHLTDAGGWRIEIDKYPKLTSETAFRTESDWRKWWDGRDRKYLPEGTPGRYGGYYTKEDIREIVKHSGFQTYKHNTGDRISGAFGRGPDGLS